MGREGANLRPRSCGTDPTRSIQPSVTTTNVGHYHNWESGFVNRKGPRPRSSLRSWGTRGHRGRTVGVSGGKSQKAAAQLTLCAPARHARSPLLAQVDQLGHVVAQPDLLDHTRGVRVPVASASRRQKTPLGKSSPRQERPAPRPPASLRLAEQSCSPFLCQQTPLFSFSFSKRRNFEM